jgi:hypothetical protein
MSNPTDQDKEANPIAEIFDEMFTLLQDLETRSVAVLEFVKEQGGATDEKLAPYLDRAGAAADVRWRAARARMDHLLAPKPKSSTDVAKGDKSQSASHPQPKEKEKDSDTATAKSKNESQHSAKPESKGLGNELASAPVGTDKSAERKDEKAQTAKPETETKTKESEQGSGKQDKQAPPKLSDAESQAASLARDAQSGQEKGKNAKTAQSENGKSSNQQPREGEQQTQKAAK